MREELVQGAVNFLQDPSVASSPLERRIAFLQAKNLTTEELAVALQRTGVDPSALENLGISPYNNNNAQRMPAPTFSGGGYGGGGYFQPSMNQQVVHEQGRDWRDWFVMATVTGSVSYGIYHLAKRYVYPLIAPPTPEALQQDKEAIDTAFSDAFALLDSLKTDTEALKLAEETRNTKVDQALEEVERVVESLKEASKRREEESKRVNDEVKNLRELIPKALEGQKESQAAALKDLQTELKSLKALLVNRAAGSRFTNVPMPAQPAVYHAPQPTPQSAPQHQATSSASASQQGSGQDAPAPAPAAKPFPSVGGRSAIPAWQLAAQAKASPAPSSATSSNAGDASAAPDASK